MSSKFYITTTLPYVNAKPHIGFALEIVQADAIARCNRLAGNEVFFNTGTDEHGLKIYQRSQEENIDPQTYVDGYAKKFDDLKKALNLSYNNFIRTTDPHHIKAAQEFWKACLKNKDIYLDKQKIKYCVGCEMEKTDSELESGNCPIHPNLKLETIEEENYFFRFSKYQKSLLDFYQKNPNFVIPQNRYNEIINFVSAGLNDFSISRLKKKLPWGIDVPDDPEHTMYVWFEALINYISAIGWPENQKEFQGWWPAIQTAGKDNLRQQSAMWQAMLMSANLPPSKQIYIHGFINSNGQKMSKSLGNVIDPFEMVNRFGTDPIRYYLLREIPPYEDGDFSIKRFKEIYNSDLANGLGNLTSRVAKLCERSSIIFKESRRPISQKIIDSLGNFRFDEALAAMWERIKKIDKEINETKPWEKDTKNLDKIIFPMVEEIQQIAIDLEPFLPETSSKILAQFKGKIAKSKTPLFPRLE